MNHLEGATSPYLAQHANNPVDWYPWGEEAFARAVERDLPVLISIGYSACHWCHVMAHESFEDEATAALLNEHFVAIKVDREERPDVDAIYMEAIQAMSGHGGWPLNAFTMPDGRPFYCGTYFPPTDRGGMLSFKGVLRAIHDTWTEKRDELVGHATELTAAVAARIAPPQSTELRPPADQLLTDALTRFSAMYDHNDGGIGAAPKFPQAPMLELLLYAHHIGAGLNSNPPALAMVQHTLAAMASGGIYDQLGGGFARYSVDASWQIPHFEKMLYDQAALARVYLHAWQITSDVRWRQIADETIDYVLRELQDDGGGIYSSEDADSEGVEGKFYAFTPTEFDSVLGTSLGARAAAWYGVTETGNFEDHTSVLHRTVHGDIVRPPDIEDARLQLFAFRETRVRPGLDDKILTEWNAMFGTVLCEAADATDNEHYSEAAVRIATFLCRELRRIDGRWMRSYRDGHSEHLAVASDYAWLVEFFYRLYTTTGHAMWKDEAVAVANSLIDLFAAQDGGLFTTGRDAEALVVRPRETYDGVTPAAGSVAANAFIRLGAICEDERFVEYAKAFVRAGGDALRESPIAFSSLVAAALSIDHPPITIVIPGTSPDLVAAAKERYLPNGVIAWGTHGDDPLFADRSEGSAYVCRFGECLAPVDSATALDDAIDRALV